MGRHLGLAFLAALFVLPFSGVAQAESPAWLGYVHVDATPWGFPVRVQRVVGFFEGTPAWQSWLQCGDRILGFKVESWETGYLPMEMFEKDARPGKPVLLLVLREWQGGGQFFELEIVPIPRPPWVPRHLGVDDRPPCKNVQERR